MRRSMQKSGGKKVRDLFFSIKLDFFRDYEGFLGILWIYPPPRIPVANEGLGWDSRA